MNNFMMLDVAGTQTPAAGGSMWTMVIYLVVIVAFFYFFMVRPQKKQERETAAMRNSLEVGDEITTIGGIMGRVVTVKDDSLIIETGADRNRMQITRWAVQQNVTATERVKAEREAARAAAEKAKAEKKAAKGKKDAE